MMDVTVPADKNIYLKEFQKISKYKGLEIGVTKLWKLRIKTTSVVTGVLGMIKNDTKNFIGQISGKASLHEMQELIITSTAHRLRKVLSM